MAPETQQSSASHSQNTPQEPWTAPDIEAALSHLSHLQSQLDTLRSTIPSLVKPLKASGSYRTQNGNVDPERAKAAIFTGVRRAAEREGAKLRELGEEWRGERTQGILERCGGSENGEGQLGRAEEVERWAWGARGEDRLDDVKDAGRDV